MRNVISSGFIAGVQIFGVDSVGNYIQGNYIGTDSEGKNRLPNGEGIKVGGTANTYILDNVISGNTKDGIIMDFADTVTGIGGTYKFENSTGVVALRNLIGTDSTRQNPLDNGEHGIKVVNKNLMHRIEKT